MAKDNIGGTLQGISLDAFLQMAQMEELSCTLSVTSGKRSGLLFLREGKLISAEAEGMSPLAAAHRIISWEKTVVIEIAESCSKTEDEIKQPLMNILMEAMRIRDDDKQSAPPMEGPEIEAAPLTLEIEDPFEASLNNGSPAAPAAQPAETPSPAPKSPKAAEAKKKAPEPKAAPSAKARSRLPWILLGLGVVLLAGGGSAFYFLSAEKETRLTYERLLTSVQSTDSLDEKLRLLSAYLATHPDGKYPDEAKREKEAIAGRKTEQDFRDTEATASRLQAGGDLERAASAYTAFLSRNKGSRYQAQASAAQSALAKQMDDRDFAKLQEETLGQGPERIAAYLAFLKAHPDSSRHKDVLTLISAMEPEYFGYTQRQMTESDASQTWGKALDFGQQFLDAYPESDHTGKVREMMAGYRKKFEAASTFEQLKKQAESLASDPRAALAVYADYLRAFPNSPIKGSVEEELRQLSARFREEALAAAFDRVARKLAEVGNRFVVEKPGTARDSKTGLTWCLLDSQDTVGKCLPYKDAQAYVASLDTGGYHDWRLPTAGELSGLYQKEQAFPAPPSLWHWSSENEKRYTGQWVIMVKVVDPARPGALTKEAWECGVVRAVRGK